MALASLPSGPTDMAEELLDSNGAADYLGIDRKAVVDLINSDRLPAFRLGQRWIIRRADVEAWARANPGDGRRGAKASKTTRAHLRTLAEIAEHPGMTVVDLAARTGEQRRTALGRLQHLERHGLITRTAGHQSDPYRCYLTEVGWDRHHAELSTARPA